MKSTPSAKNTILWADDDSDDLEVFREILRDHAPQHTLLEFANGYQLLAYLQQPPTVEPPCLIVLDMNMPVLGGRETLMRLKAAERLRDIPVVVFTTSTSPMDKSFCEKYHTEMLTKPASYTKLKATIDRLVALCTH